MRPELFHVGDLPIYSYGVMLMLGFIGALWLARALARRSGMDPEVFVNAGLIALVAGILGARLSHVLENIGTYTNPDRSAWENLKAAANLRSGGLTFYGGFIFAFACCVLYAIWKKVDVRRGMDIVAPCVMIGLGFGRIGCLLNGCCFGAVCDVPWAVSYPYGSNAYVQEVEKEGRLPPPGLAILDGDRIDAVPLAEVKRDAKLAQLAASEHSHRRHPTQIYSTLTAFLIAAVCVAYFTTNPPRGRVMALMLIVEAPSRFILELLRAEPAVIGHHSGKLEFLPAMSFSMVVSIGLLLLGIALWIIFGPKRESSGGATPRPAVA
jgi:phosphatidylglycerol---prolipoprotein diacylglyceryl transferase